MMSILRSMYGDFDFDALVEVSPITGFVYLGVLTYVVCVCVCAVCVGSEKSLSAFPLVQKRV